MSRRPLGSTYRLQLHGLGFTGARAVVPYLDALGIETLYVSPVLAAVPGSAHGYDVIDPGRLDPALGSADEFRALLDELGAHGMRLLLDIVPNHMAADPANEWWWDVLRRGEASRHAPTFDIDWSRHGGRVLVPTLDRPLGELLGAGNAVVDPAGGLVELDGRRFPLAPDSPATENVRTVLEHQHFRPAYWRAAGTQGNYRRFFDISGLVGVRVEDDEVFERTHELILILCDDDRVAGVRVDHVDGLRDPAAYLSRLRQRLGDRVIVVEKILGPGEALDARWPVDGTTGYEFGDHAGALFLDEQGVRSLRTLGAEMSGTAQPFRELARLAKRQQLEHSFAADLDRLTRLSLEALDLEMPGHDLSAHDVREALSELTVHLEVYRTYLDGDRTSRADRALLAEASSAPVPDSETRRALRSVADALANRATTGSAWLEVAFGWQQLSGAVMAKGSEDTATFRYPGLSAQVEVGSDPDLPAGDVDTFHRFGGGAHGLNATSTHDSKRNEDARCRLAVLSEASEEWVGLVRRWHRRLASSRAPHPGEELAAYQAMLALWPADRDALDPATLRRVQEFTVKAAREAGLRTSWVDPDEDYELVVTEFIARAQVDSVFRDELAWFFRRIAPSAITNALALVVLKAGVPGTPDFYQGTELVEPTLTDPDNRRPVDFAARAAALAALPGPTVSGAAGMLAGWSDGDIKLYVTHALLQLRRRQRDLFDRGDYRALPATSRHVVAFARTLERHHTVVCVVPRLTYALAGPRHFPVGRRVWGAQTVELPAWAPGPYQDVLTGQTFETGAGCLQLAEVLQTLPVATLCSVEHASVRQSPGQVGRIRHA